jgi:hypothetical protein
LNGDDWDTDTSFGTYTESGCFDRLVSSSCLSLGFHFTLLSQLTRLVAAEIDAEQPTPTTPARAWSAAITIAPPLPDSWRPGVDVKC